MDVFNKVVTKKNVLLASGALVVILAVEFAIAYAESAYCVANHNCASISMPSPFIQSESFFLLTLMNVPVFALCLMTASLRKEVFKTWFWFTVVFIPSLMLYISTLEGGDHTGGWFPAISPQTVVTLEAPLLYLLSGLGVVAVTAVIVRLRTGSLVVGHKWAFAGFFAGALMAAAIIAFYMNVVKVHIGF